MSNRPPTEATLRRLERSSGALATRAVARMDDELPWFRAMPADRRSWVTLVAQNGIASLVEWCRDPGQAAAADRRRVRRRAPRAGAGGRPQADRRPHQGHRRRPRGARRARWPSPGDEDALHLAVLQFSREVAFATAHVYASFAENRGAWDARLEALVVDALVRGERSEELSGRAAALGWATSTPVVVLVGATPAGVEDPHAAVRRAARSLRSEVLVGRARRPAGRRPRPATADLEDVAERVSEEFGDGPVVSGPVVDGLGQAGESAAAALAGLRAARRVAGGAPARARPTRCSPSGRWTATRWPGRSCTSGWPLPLQAAGGEVLETVRAVLNSGGNLEASARAIFVHPNTVRYRLKRAAELTGLSATDPRGSWTLQVALALAQLDRDRSLWH